MAAAATAQAVAGMVAAAQDGAYMAATSTQAGACMADASAQAGADKMVISAPHTCILDAK